MSELEIRKLEIDFDSRSLKINGEDFTEKPIVVTLPGPEGWPLSMLLNPETAIGNPEESVELIVSFNDSNNTPK